jgi:hypothetical protein
MVTLPSMAAHLEHWDPLRAGLSVSNAATWSFNLLLYLVWCTL